MHCRPRNRSRCSRYPRSDRRWGDQACRCRRRLRRCYPDATRRLTGWIAPQGFSWRPARRWDASGRPWRPPWAARRVSRPPIAGTPPLPPEIGLGSGREVSTSRRRFDVPDRCRRRRRRYRRGQARHLPAAPRPRPHSARRHPTMPTPAMADRAEAVTGTGDLSSAGRQRSRGRPPTTFEVPAKRTPTRRIAASSRTS